MLTAPARLHPRFRFGGLACLVVSALSSVAIGLAFTPGWAPDVRVAGVWSKFLCDFSKAPPLDALRLYAAHSNWVGVLVLEAVIAAIALVCTVATLVAVGQSHALWRRWEFWLLLVFGVGAVAFDGFGVAGMRTSATPRAFLTQLLASVPFDCPSVRSTVFWARFIGEPVGIALGVAICATATFAEKPEPREVAKRIERVQRLLYVASLLFVAGILVSRANFTWVLAHWQIGDDDKMSKALGEVIKAGVVQSGVGYSALLTVFYLPVRVLLAQHVDALIPKDTTRRAKRNWLADQGLSASWQREARQALALLAPILSAPIFDALAKL